MHLHQLPRRASGRPLLSVLGVVLSIAVVGTVVVSGLVSRLDPGSAVGAKVHEGIAGVRVTAGGDTPVGRDDGLIPEGALLTVNDDHPAMTGLDRRLRAALRAATNDAALDGQPIHVTTGWRSERYQAQLFEQARARHGSDRVARQFVAPPELSTHLTGKAVDVGPLDAQLWLMEHGADYGLCQTYANERWHFELAAEPGGSCPEMLPDASHLGR